MYVYMYVQLYNIPPAPCAAVECFFKTCGINSQCTTSTSSGQAVCVCIDGFKKDKVSKACVGEAEFCVDCKHVDLCYSNVHCMHGIRY